MRAIIAGGTGFIGRALIAELQKNNWEIIVLSRTPSRVAEVFGSGVIGMVWNGGGDWSSLLGPQTVVVNLAGENISGRWTTAKKQRILESRLKAGEKIVQAVKSSEQPPAALIQASAVGFYGPHQSTPLNEEHPGGTGFLADVARQWEDSTKSLEKLGVRRCIIRTGMVLGHGGALKQMLPPFRMFMGGPVGHGHQGVSWIHLLDEVRAIRFLMENESEAGAYNLTAPNPTDFNKFAKILGEVLNRPSWLRTQPFVLRALFGSMADELLLTGQFALPEALQRAGFEFRFPDLKSALSDLLAR
jgi:hypothetical protein